ncbi:MAG: HDIG domain-containing protein [Verrucomicrobia bacterium]|nr:HDIG domain-containing protein [Verrucomicrobiota bacterium]MBU4292010.1 HDIG domain-containing protein [Verrucomicrobiota bacterium]MBU4427898.1 HDIG domain-containing protein [Verrucomicrobiota bacterium]MCG2678844.1 HDIG domain-containing protein [Kiritimatiellia bacterium]
MMFPFFSGFFKKRRERLTSLSASAIARRAEAILGLPAIGLFYWVLAWLSAITLQSVWVDLDVDRWSVGQPAPATVIAKVNFDVPIVTASKRATAGARVIPKQPPRVETISAGTRLVAGKQFLTPDILATLRAHQLRHDEGKLLFRQSGTFAGNALLMALGVMLSALLLQWVPPGRLSRNSMILLFVVIAILTLLLAKWCLVLDRLVMPLPPAVLSRLLPLALAPILAAILIGPWPAIIMGFWISYAAAIFAGYDFPVFVIGLAMTVVTARLARSVRTRAKVLRIGLLAGAAGGVFAVGFALVAHQPWLDIIQQVVASLTGGLISALVVLMILPLLEILFGVTTDISLLEFADMEHPLLKRLTIEAAGTYHHSLMVANLAQAAVAAIGGNSLRVTICSYFHDIGKLVKPEFFSENIPLESSPHDELVPSMSSLVITAHVKEGINLALRYKLPWPVLEAIQQHHGTGLVSFFYHKASLLQSRQSDAQANARPDTVVHEEDFRYPGPKPRSREIAVLALADAIEAASRSLEKITSGHVENLVHDIISSKLKDGQLDECDLTLQEISRISQSFVFTLINMLHGRIRYPNNERSHQQQAESRADEPS